MKRGILLIFLAGGLALSAVSRADDSASPAFPGKTRDLKERAVLLKKLHHKRNTPFALPGLPQPQSAQPQANNAPAGVVPSNNVSPAPVDPNNPYDSIVSRNVFDLKPIPPPDALAQQPPGPPPPKITLTGITTIFGPPEALFTVAGVIRQGRPPHDESYIFTEGEAQDDVEVTSINTKMNTVTFNNHGVVQVIPLVEGTASDSGSPDAAPAAPFRSPNFRMRRFGRNFGGAGNFQPPSYQPQSSNGGQSYGGSSYAAGGAGNSDPYAGFYNNNNNSLNNSFNNTDSSGNFHSYPNVSPVAAGLSDDEQQTIIAAEHQQMVQSGDPLAAIMPPSIYDNDASQAMTGNNQAGQQGSDGSSAPRRR